MKKLMLIIGVLMIAGGISAHGYDGDRGYDRDDRGGHGRVIVQATYNTNAFRRPEPIVRYNQYQYRNDCNRDRRYDRDRCYRGYHDRDDRYYR